MKDGVGYPGKREAQVVSCDEERAERKRGYVDLEPHLARGSERGVAVELVTGAPLQRPRNAPRVT